MTVNVIAEVGCNHMGSMDSALKHIRMAKNCDADIVKFQAYVTEKVNDKRLHQLLDLAWLSSTQHTTLKKECESQGMKYLCSAFDVVSADMLSKIGCEWVKVPSGQNINHELVAFCLTKFNKVFISLGMMTEKERLGLLNNENRGKIIPMHCVSCYPCSPRNANLAEIGRFKDYSFSHYGYSDHSMTPMCAMMAVGLGAEYIEHHFSLDFAAETPDAEVSFDYEQFKKYVYKIRQAQTAAGKTGQGVTECEKLMSHRRYSNNSLKDD